MRCIVVTVRADSNRENRFKPLTGQQLERDNRASVLCRLNYKLKRKKKTDDNNKNEDETTENKTIEFN